MVSWTTLIEVRKRTCSMTLACHYFVSGFLRAQLNQRTLVPDTFQRSRSHPLFSDLISVTWTRSKTHFGVRSSVHR
ncbi:hypothetical protein VTN00DRAFT_5959 [Thermoascus crustaceus]|uniref:uncharacterized protein n=1 Tax=Thermoascus crustaceus TaxID=5088 RepID=UPI003742E668